MKRSRNWIRLGAVHFSMECRSLEKKLNKTKHGGGEEREREREREKGKEEEEEEEEEEDDDDEEKEIAYRNPRHEFRSIPKSTFSFTLEKEILIKHPIKRVGRWEGESKRNLGAFSMGRFRCLFGFRFVTPPLRGDGRQRFIHFFFFTSFQPVPLGSTCSRNFFPPPPPSHPPPIALLFVERRRTTCWDEKSILSHRQFTVNLSRKTWLDYFSCELWRPLNFNQLNVDCFSQMPDRFHAMIRTFVFVVIIRIHHDFIWFNRICQ